MVQLRRTGREEYLRVSQAVLFFKNPRITHISEIFGLIRIAGPFVRALKVQTGFVVLQYHPHFGASGHNDQVLPLGPLAKPLPCRNWLRRQEQTTLYCMAAPIDAGLSLEDLRKYSD
jgi:hypothetical protein